MTAARSLRRLAFVAVLLLLVAPARAQTVCGDAVTVTAGDTLYRIAERCNTSVDAILAANADLDDPNVIYPGQVLDMPGEGEAGSVDEPVRTEPADPGAERYVVKPGDTLAEIAARFATSLADLLGANPQIDDPNRIDVGLEIDLPGADEPSPPFAGRGDVDVSPQSGPPGADVRLTATGFPRYQTVRIGAGPMASEYEIIETATTNAEGRLETEVEVPGAADPGQRWIFVVETPDHDLKARSEPFAVERSRAERPDQQPDRDARHIAVKGRLTDEGVECPAVRGSDGRLYTLAGDVDGFETGDYVRVQGMAAEVSICMQGTTIDVESIRPWQPEGRDDDMDGDDNLKKVLRIEGMLTNEGVECPALRAEDGTLYTLAGDVQGFETGDRVYVEAVKADMSFCMQGTTLEVRTIRAAE